MTIKICLKPRGENIVNWHYVKSREGTVEEGGANDAED